MARKFLFLRLHSLAGILPLGLFLLEHFYTNSLAMLGSEGYNKQIEMIQSIPFLPVIEVLLIAVPLIYHAVFGIYIAFIARNNVVSYSYSRNWMFVLQRSSGVITLIFIIYHLWVFRISKLLFGTQVDYNAVHVHLTNPWIFIFYVVGVLSTTFHFSNGIWGALITWGITIGPKAQRRSAIFTYAVFAVLSISGIAILFSF